MANLSDFIEKHLKDLLHRSSQGTIEIQRNELAEQFRCVPSQINYVLETRFTCQRGYLVESRRGGGGYVRIVRVWNGDKEDDWLGLIGETIGDAISQHEAIGIVQRLLEEDFLTRRESMILGAIIDRRVLKGDLPERDYLRARLLRTALLSTLKGE